MKFAKFLTTFLTKEFQWLLLTFNSCFQRSPEQKPVRLSAKNTKFCCKKVLAAPKIQKQPPQVLCRKRPTTFLERGSSIAKFLRTPILKNIWERLLLKISFSVTNLPAVNQLLSDKFTEGRQFLIFAGLLNLLVS